LLRMDMLSDIQRLFARLERMIVDRVDRMETALSLASADYLSIKQAASWTSLSPSHIRRSIKTGDLAASNCGTSSHPLWRISRTDLIAWMEKKKGGTTTVPPKSDMEELIQRHLPGLRGRKDSATR
jgi:excisionase family DNA binding protein